MQSTNNLNFSDSYFNEFSHNSKSVCFYNELIKEKEKIISKFSALPIDVLKHSEYFNKILNDSIEEKCEIIFTYSVFEMISYIENRRKNCAFCKNHASDPSLEQIHKKATEIIIKNSNLNLLLMGYLFDEGLSLHNSIIPKEIIQLIIESNLNLELLDFKYFQKTILEDLAKYF